MPKFQKKTTTKKSTNRGSTGDLLQRLDALLRDLLPDAHAALRPGVTSAAIVAAEQAIGVKFPTALVDLYTWHDGQDSGCSGDCPPEFYDAHMLMPLAKVVETWEEHEDLTDINDYRDWWNIKWIPFLNSVYGATHICLDMGGSFDGKTGQLLRFVNDDEGRQICFPSIDSWLECYVSSLEAAMWKSDGSRLEIDYDVWEKFISSNCPGYPREEEATLE